MSVTNSDQDSIVLRGPDDLLRPFHEACKPESEFRVGTEAEKFGVLAASGEPLPFEGGDRSVRGVLAALQERFGWQPDREHAEGDVIALHRDRGSITLEPGGQLELSGAPHESIHATCREFRQHIAELREICDPLGVTWLSVGFHPFARLDELPRVPKFRYGIMESYLPTRGARGLDMMFRTCTVQANLDYSSEADAVRKLRVSLALQPITTAIFANSPLHEGKSRGRISERADVWLNMDPDRSGLLPFAWDANMSFQAYVEWALDAPMFLIKRGARVIPNTHQTFRQYLREGSEGQSATLTDWRTHLNTLFPEARLKNTLEMRGGDAQPTDLTCAMPALWKGLLYDAQALDRAESMISPLSPQLVQDARLEISRVGLQAKLASRSVQEWASELLALASAGLERHGIKNEKGETEAVHLTRLSALIADGKSAGSVLLDQIRGRSDLRAAVIEAARV